MLIGFASELAPASERAPDVEILRELGCERIFSAAQGVFVIEDVIQYLRPGDVLAVADLSRLGNNLERLIQLLEQVDSAGAGVHVAGTDIVPDTALGQSFAKACAALAGFSRMLSQQAVSTPRVRARGRPVALPPEAQIRVERLLKRGGISVAEIARGLNVSPATVYRYFPRGARTTKIETTAKPRRPLRDREQPTPSKR